MRYARHRISTSISVNDKLDRDEDREVSSRRNEEEKEALTGGMKGRAGFVVTRAHLL